MQPFDIYMQITENNEMFEIKWMSTSKLLLYPVISKMAFL